jgi:hypothetical protein
MRMKIGLVAAVAFALGFGLAWWLAPASRQAVATGRGGPGAEERQADVEGAKGHRRREAAARGEAAERRAGDSTRDDQEQRGDDAADQIAGRRTDLVDWRGVGCALYLHHIRKLEARLRDAEDKIARVTVYRAGRYDAARASGRRVQAAHEGNLLLEFPALDDHVGLPEAVALKYGLSEADRLDLSARFSGFKARLESAIGPLYEDLVGEPHAGEHLTLEAKLQGILNLSGNSACRDRLAAILEALESDIPLPAQPDALACEGTVRAVYALVDALDEAVAASYGENGVKALWNNFSSYEFNVRQAAE